ncbi:hypothetical protein HDG32_003293 [Paraburkholderia sp. CI2]|nr:hypothetical protein [Paraburkholderia sp. CI2]
MTSFIVLPASPASAEPSRIRSTDVAIGSSISWRRSTSVARGCAPRLPRPRSCESLLAGARRFDGRVQRENVGLKRNASMIAVMSAIFVELSMMCHVVLTTSGRPPRCPSAQQTTQ